MPDDRKPPKRQTRPFGIKLNDDERDRRDLRRPPKHIADQLAGEVPLHEIPFETTNELDMTQLIAKTYKRSKELSGILKVHAARIDGIDDKVDNLLGDTRVQTEILHEQSKTLGEIVRMRFQVDAHREVSDIRVREVRQTTQIEDEADKKKKRRTLAIKIVGAIAGALASGGVLALLAARSCG